MRRLLLCVPAVLGTVATLAEVQETSNVRKEWQNVTVVVIDAAQQPRTTTLFEFANGEGPKARAVREALDDGVKSLRADQVPDFIRAFSTRGFPLAEQQKAGGKVVKEMTPFSYELDVSDDELFAAEVSVMRDCLAVNACGFRKYPPLSDPERDTLQSQLDVVFQRLSETAASRGLSSDARDELEDERRLFKARVRPGDYGRTPQPLAPDTLGRLLEEIGAGMPSADASINMTTEDQKSVLRTELRRIYRAFVRKRTEEGPGSELLALTKKLGQSSEAMWQIKRERILATQPAATSRPSTE